MTRQSCRLDRRHLALGTALGAALGVALDDVGLWLGVGVASGLVLARAKGRGDD